MNICCALAKLVVAPMEQFNLIISQFKHHPIIQLLIIVEQLIQPILQM
jgi:hypothetical protein